MRFKRDTLRHRWCKRWQQDVSLSLRRHNRQNGGRERVAGPDDTGQSVTLHCVDIVTSEPATHSSQYANLAYLYGRGAV